MAPIGALQEQSQMLKRVAELLSLCCLALGGANASAQSAVPVAQEPAHRLVLSNDYVSVFDVSLPSGHDTLWHVHRHDGVSVRMADATIEDQSLDGETETLHLRRGAVAYGATPTALTHRVRNVGATPFHNIYIELLRSPGGANGRSAAPSHRPAEFENDRVRALRRILAPGESTDTHTHESNGVAVLLTTGRLQISNSEGVARTGDVSAGAVQWIASGTTHALRNVGDAPMEIIDIELK